MSSRSEAHFDTQRTYHYSGATNPNRLSHYADAVVKSLLVFLFPIKLALVVLYAERREQPLGVLVSTSDGAHLRARLTVAPCLKMNCCCCDCCSCPCPAGVVEGERVRKVPM